MDEDKKEMIEEASNLFGDASGEINIAGICIHEKTIVRINMMENKNYRPYCGNDHCIGRWPRVVLDGNNEFVCPSCGWVAKFDPEFFGRYKEKWGFK